MPNTEATQADDGPATARSGALFADILCAIDGTRRSYTAVEQAAVLAGPGGALTLLAVTAVAGSGAYKSAAINSARVKRVLAHAKRIAEEAGVQSNEVIDPGDPAAVILQAAAQHELVALGAPAMSWLGGMLVGTVGHATLQSLTTPMLMARPTPRGVPFASRILIASDGVAGSDRVVELASRLAGEREARVTLLHADGAESPTRPPDIQAQADALQSALPGRSEVVLKPGSARETIVETAGNIAASLIVMGSRRGGGLRALGSVSRRVVHDAPCSVLLVPPSGLLG